MKGTETSAMMYSVAATACANGMKVEDYLTELFRSQPGTLSMPWLMNIENRQSFLWLAVLCFCYVGLFSGY